MFCFFLLWDSDEVRQTGHFYTTKIVHIKIFVDKLRLIKFPDYSNHACVNNAYQDFVAKFLSAAKFVSPIRILGVKTY